MNYDIVSINKTIYKKLQEQSSEKFDLELAVFINNYFKVSIDKSDDTIQKDLELIFDFHVDIQTIAEYRKTDLEEGFRSFFEAEEWFRGSRGGKYKKGDPVLRGFLTQYIQHPYRTTLIVWCPYCVKYHHHGWHLADDKEPLHRIAHCGDEIDSPFHKTGYWIEPFEYKRRKDFTIKNKYPKPIR